MISICIPAYKAAAFLPQALESIRTQTHGDGELIVIEDGSDDGTRALVENFAADVSQSVRYLRHEENRGLSATRNTGFAAANADRFRRAMTRTADTADTAIIPQSYRMVILLHQSTCFQ